LSVLRQWIDVLDFFTVNFQPSCRRAIRVY
jgi:hypothetical protein